MPEKLVNTLEKFVHQIHGGNRWTLFRSRNLRGNLPPTRATLVMHICRANYAAAIDKSWTQWCPNLPAPVGYGWEMRGQILVATISSQAPAPEQVMNLIKCKCTRDECKCNCKCFQNTLPCTVLCECNCKVSQDSLDQVPQDVDLEHLTDDEDEL